MNISFGFGFIIAVCVLWFGVIHPSSNAALFLDPHAIILVFGGTLGAATMAYSFKKILKIFQFLLFGVVFKSSDSESKIATQLAETYYCLKVLKQTPDAKKYHIFITESLLLLKKAELMPEDIADILDQRILSLKKAYLADAKILNAIAKYPPAFGLLGASTGMIAMMTNLGDGGAEKIGPAMAIALVATFWGIAMANLVILPLADYATKVTTDEVHTRSMIRDGMVTIATGADFENFTERIKSHLSLNDREDFETSIKAFQVSNVFNFKPNQSQVS
jgi:chemotaxis protein MotA